MKINLDDVRAQLRRRIQMFKKNGYAIQRRFRRIADGQNSFYFETFNDMLRFEMFGNGRIILLDELRGKKQVEFAREIGVAPQHLNDALWLRRTRLDYMLKRLGYEKVEIWQKKAAE